MKWFIIAVLAIGGANIFTKRVIEVLQDIERSEGKLYNIILSGFELLLSAAVFTLAVVLVVLL